MQLSSTDRNVVKQLIEATSQHGVKNRLGYTQWSTPAALVTLERTQEPPRDVVYIQIKEGGQVRGLMNVTNARSEDAGMATTRPDVTLSTLWERVKQHISV